MAVEVRMPAYSESMEEADVVGWLVGPGDRVNEGDPIAEIETDKATGELEAPASGVLSQIVVAEGTHGVKVGELLAFIEPAIEAEAALETRAEVEAIAQPRSEEPATGDAPSAADLAATDGSGAPPASPAVAIAPDTPRQGERPQSAETAPARAEISASALARRLADRAGLDLSTIEGSGAGGRILKADVESVSAESTESTVSAGRPPQQAVLQRGDAAGAPALTQLQLRVECRADAARDACDRLSALEPDAPVPLLALMLRAAAGALREVPEANTAWSDGRLVDLDEVVIALDLPGRNGDPRHVRDADRKSLAVLAKEIAAEQPARPAEGVSALSIVDIAGAEVESLQLSSASPSVCVLATAALGERPVAVEGELAIAEVVGCTLAADTRAIDARTAARLLSAFKLRIEDPLEMILH